MIRNIDANTAREQWIERAKAIKTSEELRVFIDELKHDYKHDYGTICEAIAAAAIAGFYAIENSPQGGITGFQGGFVTWRIIRELGSWGPGPLQMIEWSHLMYPQYDHEMPPSIRRSTLEQVQALARERLRGLSPEASSAVRERLEILAAGGQPSWLHVYPG